MKKMKLSQGILLFLSVSILGTLALIWITPQPEASTEETPDITLVSPLSDAERLALESEFTTGDYAASPDQAMADLQSLAEEDPRVMRDCYNIARIIGNNAYSEQDNLSSALERGSDWCNSGYIHGALEMYMLQDTQALATINEICEDDSDPLAQWHCLHGLGHAFMFSTEGELEQSLIYCNALENAEHEQTCANGAIMEFFSPTDAYAVDETEVDTTTVLETCVETASHSQAAYCHLYAPLHFLSKTPNAYEDALEFCTKTKNRSVCAYGVGAQVHKEHPSAIIAAEKLCEEVDRVAEDCKRGLFAYAAFHYNDTAWYETACTQLSEEGEGLCNSVKGDLTAQFAP